MSKFFNDTMQGLLEAVAIKNGEIKMREVSNMPAKTLRTVNASKSCKQMVVSSKKYDL